MWERALLRQNLETFRLRVCAECYGVHYLLFVEVEEGLGYRFSNWPDAAEAEKIFSAVREMQQRRALPREQPVPIDAQVLGLEPREEKYIFFFPIAGKSQDYGFLLGAGAKPWPEQQVAVTAALASALGTLLDQIYQEMKLGQVLLTVVNSAVKAIEARDPYTRGHSDRVAAYAARLATLLGKGQQEVELLRLAAQLHDIGKIGIRDRILGKPGPLDASEWEEMRRHPVIGEEILKPIKLLTPALVVVRHHHERYDGRGYPDGLAGEAIPWSARLVAVADAYEAMTSDRPYRRALPARVALEELAAKAGSQFDPEIVQAMLALGPELEERVAAPA